MHLPESLLLRLALALERGLHRIHGPGEILPRVFKLLFFLLQPPLYLLPRLHFEFQVGVVGLYSHFVK